MHVCAQSNHAYTHKCTVCYVPSAKESPLLSSFVLSCAIFSCILQSIDIKRRTSKSGGSNTERRYTYSRSGFIHGHLYMFLIPSEVHATPDIHVHM